MAILKSQPRKPDTATIQARVDESLKFQLEKYADFIQWSPSYVIADALKHLFKRDEQFKNWLNQRPTGGDGHQTEGGVLTKTV